MLFDAHLHLADEFKALDIKRTKDIINRAKEAGVKYFLSNTLNQKTIDETISLAKTLPEIFLGLGFFPTEFKNDKDIKKVEYLKEKIKEIKKIGLERKFFIGEIGLDFKDPNSNKDLQTKTLIEMLKIAKEENVYVEIHSRFAVKQVVSLLEEFGYNKIIMHWFMDSKKYIEKVSKLGYFITIGPKYLYDQNIFENIKDVPKEQILFETDYPAQVAGKIQNPETIKQIFEKYCKDQDIGQEEMQATLTKSLKKIFPNLEINK